jgi:hypothetical protein
VAVGCHGDGVSGNRGQVVYVRQSDRADRFGAVLGALRREVNVANGVFTRSSDGRRAVSGRDIESDSVTQEVSGPTRLTSSALDM